MSLLTGKILLLLFSAIGLVGTLFPSVPGTILIWLSAVVFAYFTEFSLLTAGGITFLTVLAVLGQVLSYLLSLVGAKIGGATKRGIFGALAGAVIGLVIAGPVGLLLGSFFGAVAMELTNKELTEALRAGIGALLGAAGGVVIEFIIGLVMVFHIVTAIF